MKSDSDWRIQLAQRIAPIYHTLPDVSAMVVIGGVARERGDRYSDLDLALYWARPPTHVERRLALAQYEVILGIPVVISDLATHPISDEPGDGVWWEEAAFIGGDAQSGFKIDVNHHTVASMSRIVEAVVQRHDTDGGKLERLYSIQRVYILFGDELIRDWQQQAAVYPEALAVKLINLHLSQLTFDVQMHLHRNDLLLFYQTLGQAQANLLGALLALNHIYRPEFKRLADLAGEMHLKPARLVERLNRMWREEPETAVHSFEKLTDETVNLIEQCQPTTDLSLFRRAFYTRRQPYDQSPLTG